MTIELVGLGEVMKKATQRETTAVDLKDLQVQFLAKEKAAEAALEAAEKATEAAEELRIKLAEAVAKDEEASEAKAKAVGSAETKEQKIARLKKELNELETRESTSDSLENNEKPATTTTTTTTETLVATPKVTADKLNVTSAPKAEVAVEVYEPESPKTGAKGAAARRK